MQTRKMHVTKFSRVLALVSVIVINAMIDTTSFTLVDGKPSKRVERLLLVNVFNRHGDRSPITPLPRGDKHAQRIDFFWPNGLDNLTSSGELRMFRLGLALRQRYKDFLDYETKSVLALTSDVQRCRKSLESTLRGFYDMTQSLEDGERLAHKLRMGQIDDIPSGPGNSLAWKNVELNEELVPSLSYGYVRKSSYAKNNRHPMKNNLMVDPNIGKLVGIYKLRQQIKDRYGLDFSSKIFVLLSTIQSELYLDRTKETIDYLDHFADWIDEPVGDAEFSPITPITMLEVLDQVNLLGFTGMLDDSSNYLVVSPIVNSLIESQMVALNEPFESASLFSPDQSSVRNSRIAHYDSKKLIFYSTHDTVLTALLYDLGIVSPLDGPSFGKRLVEAKQSNASDLDKLLGGLKTCHYGLSAIFELWLVEMETGDQKPVVRLAMYNEANPKLPTVEWKSIPFGKICQRRFLELYPGQDPKQFYGSRSELDAMDCPFELFKKIADNWKFDQIKYEKIYRDNI